MNTRQQLRELVRLQEIAYSARAQQERIDAAPGRLEAIESAFRERNAEYVSVRERFEAVEADRRNRSIELAALDEQRTKYQDDLMQVQNTREYAAILREIDTVKAHIGEHEESILRDLEETETLAADLAERQPAIEEERRRVDAERASVEAEVAESQKKITALVAERRELEGRLPRALVNSVERLEAGRQGVFLARADDGTCQSCYVRIRPQVFQEIRQATEIHSCSSCRRLLVFEASLRAPKEVPGDPLGVAEVSALEGGAV